MCRKGIAISFEGGDGTGKTTVVKQVQEYLESRGYSVLTTREPGGVRISEMIRDIILNQQYSEVDPRTEALLFAAARRQHLVEKVLPALQAGDIVLIDRFLDSSLVYQGVSRGIGVEEVLAINRFAIEDFMPALTILLDADPEVALRRVSHAGREVNKLDVLPLAFHRTVRSAYLQLSKKYSDRIKVICAERDLEHVVKDCIERIETYMAGADAAERRSLSKK